MTHTPHTPGPLENAGRTLYATSGVCIASIWSERDQEDGRIFDMAN